MGASIPDIPRPAPRRPWPEVLRERVLGTLQWIGPRRVAASLVLASATAVGGWWLLHAPPPAVERSLPVAGARTGAATSTPPAGGTSPAEVGTPSTSSPPGSPVVVHVAGAVAHPGLVRLATASRVDDAITAAGGALPEADLDAVNLAAPVIDGSRIYVPRVGEVVPAVVAGGGGAGSGPGGSAAGPVDLNTATAEQLDALPGIGPATARAIVTHRQANGPFRSVEDLLDVKGIGPAKLEQFRSLVTV